MAHLILRGDSVVPELGNQEKRYDYQKHQFDGAAIVGVALLVVN